MLNASNRFPLSFKLLCFQIQPRKYVLLSAGPAITHFQQVESKGAIFWEPLVFAIGLAEAYRVGLGWAEPTSSNFNKLREDYVPGDILALLVLVLSTIHKPLTDVCILQFALYL